jgi:hypothetical protein
MPSPMSSAAEQGTPAAAGTNLSSRVSHASGEREGDYESIRTIAIAPQPTPQLMSPLLHLDNGVRFDPHPVARGVDHRPLHVTQIAQHRGRPRPVHALPVDQYQVNMTAELKA